MTGSVLVWGFKNICWGFKNKWGGFKKNWWKSPEIADDYAGKIKICKINNDENDQTPPKYNIRGIPTLMLFKNGNVDATKVGALSKSQLTAFVDSNL